MKKKKSLSEQDINAKIEELDEKQYDRECRLESFSDWLFGDNGPNHDPIAMTKIEGYVISIIFAGISACLFAAPAVPIFVPIILCSILGGWYPISGLVYGVMKVNSMLKAKRTNKKISKLKKELEKTKFLGNEKSCRTELESMYLTTEDNLECLKQKEAQIKQMIKQKTKDKKKKAKLLKKLDILKQSQDKLDNKIFSISQNIEKSETYKNSDIKKQTNKSKNDRCL